MTREEAIICIGSLKTAEKRSGEKAKQRLIRLLKRLELKDYAPEHRLMVENELDHIFNELQKGKGSQAHHLHLAHQHLLGFLERNFSLIPDGHYGGLGMLWGTLVGAFFLSFSHLYIESFYRFLIPLAGMSLGVLIGAILDDRAERKGRTILTQHLKRRPVA